MSFQIDQSGKVEDTAKDMVVEKQKTGGRLRGCLSTLVGAQAPVLVRK